MAIIHPLENHVNSPRQDISSRYRHAQSHCVPRFATNAAFTLLEFTDETVASARFLLRSWAACGLTHGEIETALEKACRGGKHKYEPAPDCPLPSPAPVARQRGAAVKADDAAAGEEIRECIRKLDTSDLSGNPVEPYRECIVPTPPAGLKQFRQVCPRAMWIALVNPDRQRFRAGRTFCSCLTCEVCCPILIERWKVKFKWAINHDPVCEWKTKTRKNGQTYKRRVRLPGELGWRKTSRPLYLHEVEVYKGETVDMVRKRVERRDKDKRLKVLEARLAEAKKPKTRRRLRELIRTTKNQTRVTPVYATIKSLDGGTSFLFLSNVPAVHLLHPDAVEYTQAEALKICLAWLEALPSPCTIKKPINLSQLWTLREPPTGWLRVGAFPSETYAGKVGEDEIRAAMEAEGLAIDEKQRCGSLLDLVLDTELPGYQPRPLGGDREELLIALGLRKKEAIAAGKVLLDRIVWRIKGIDPGTVESIEAGDPDLEAKLMVFGRRRLTLPQPPDPVPA